jgi:hypothetical protein
VTPCFTRAVGTLAGTIALAGCGTAAATPTPAPTGSATTTATVTAPPTASATARPATTPTSDPTAGWTVATSSAGHFSVRHDPSWSVIYCSPAQPNITDTAILLFPDGRGTSSSNCPEEGSGQAIIQIDSALTADAGSTQPSTCGETLYSTGSVTASGVVGTEKIYHPLPASQQQCQGSPYGYLEIYTFNTGGRTFTVSDQELPSSPDVRAAVRLMVVDTLTFS